MGSKFELIAQIRIAESKLGITGPAKLGPLHRHTVPELRELWKRYYHALQERGLVVERKEVKPD